MPTLTEDIDLPGGVDPSTVSATIQLWGLGEPVTGFEQGTGKSIAGPRKVTGNPWTVENLVGNVAIDLPTGTVYRVERTWVGLPEPLVDYVTMPTSGGPYRLDQVLTDPPDDLPTLSSTNELDVAEITGNLTLSGFNGFNIIAVPGMTVTVPNTPRVCWNKAQVWMEHASAANVNLATMIGATGLTTIGTQSAAGVGFVGAAGKETSPEAWARWAASTPQADRDVYVYSDTAGNVNVIANGSNPLRHAVFGM